jgi:hypothetical protein
MEEALCQRACGEAGFAIGARLLALIDEERGDEDADVWNVVRAMAAKVTGINYLRAASAVSDQILAAILHANDAIDTGIPPSVEPGSLLDYLRDMPEADLTEDLTMLHSELHAIRVRDRADDEPIVSAGAVSAVPSGEDVGLRTDALDNLEKNVQEKWPQRQPKYPRVDPPEVEDQVGQGIPENTPGYIAQAFPKLFPHGCGDFHTPRGSLPKLLKFEEWGRYVMMWHDGRFARHSRFRYWLLDTSLRLMTPGMQRTFFKTREAARFGK